MSEPRRSPGAALEPTASGVRTGAPLLCGLLTSCLVTSAVDYDPPVILSQVDRAEPQTEFVQMPVEPQEECARDGSGYMRFVVQIRDLNREEELRMRVVVNKTLLFERIVSPNGNELRTIEPAFFCVEEDQLSQPCNLVEAVVSSSFEGFNRREPYKARLDDVSSAHWWVIGNAEDNPSAGYADCPDPRPDAGAP